jgi:hypothetical protein
MRPSIRDARQIIAETRLEPVVENAAELLTTYLLLLQYKVSDATDGHTKPISARRLREEFDRIRQWADEGRRMFAGLSHPAFTVLTATEPFDQEDRLEQFLAEVACIQGAAAELVEQIKKKDRTLFSGTHLKRTPVAHGKPRAHLTKVLVAGAATAYRAIFNREPAYNPDLHGIVTGPFPRFLVACSEALGVEEPLPATTVRRIIKE